jgi:hypothetical protein
MYKIPKYNEIKLDILFNPGILGKIGIIKLGIVTVISAVASDPRVSFEGIKKSDFGRELSRYGMLEFVNIKLIGL